MNLPSPGTEVVQTITVPVGTDGKIQVISSASVNLVVYLLGYYSPAVSAKSGRFRTLAELKILDRSISPLPIGGLLDLKLPAAVPRDAEAVVMTITVSGAIRSGSWYHTSSGRSVPIVASRSGETTSNTFLARPTSGSVTISTDSGGFATVTISGWYTGRSSTSGSDGLFVPQAPLRLLDTTSPLDPLGPGVALHSSWTLESPVSGAAGVPSSGVGAVSIVLGSRNSMGAGRTTVYAAGQVRPDVGHITATRVGHATSTSLQVAVGERGLAVYSEPGSDITVDVVGWFTGQPQTSVVPRPVNAMPPAERFPGVLWVPDIKLFTMVREDTSLVDLDPSHLPESRSPNQPGNVAIFGHRTSHGREFRNLDQMKQGSMIVLAVGRSSDPRGSTPLCVLLGGADTDTCRVSSAGKREVQDRRARHAHVDHWTLSGSAERQQSEVVVGALQSARRDRSSFVGADAKESRQFGSIAHQLGAADLDRPQ
jgi:hypothetical protein